MFLDFASVWEEVADAVPDTDAIVQGGRRVSYRGFDDASARFAAALEATGLGEGAKVGLYLHNCPEYLIAQYGAFKHRSIPINVNYRYLDSELVYLLENCDAELLVFHSSLGRCVERVRDQLRNLKALVEVDDDGSHVEGSVRFDDFLASHEPQERKERAGTDPYMLYTGGTTGMPKGVIYAQGEFTARLLEGVALVGVDVTAPRTRDEIAPFVKAIAERGVEACIPCCPLMHGTGMWVGAMPPLLAGTTVVLLESKSFDAHEVWRLVDAERVTRLVIVGDPFARPLLRALEERERDGHPHDGSSVRSIISAGAIWSAEIKDGLRSRLTATLIDALGSTEGGTYAISSADHNHEAATAQFVLSPDTRVVTEDRRDVARGTGERGLLVSRTSATGYYKDPEKTAKTFIEIDGDSFVITGDWATVDANGVITLLGRGSNCINTGGEKVFPEEVEEAIKRHPLVEDCLVVGVPDERLGQRVVAVVGAADEHPSKDTIVAFLSTSLAHFKIPRDVVVRDAVHRAPNGKADYEWALNEALSSLAGAGEAT